MVASTDRGASLCGGLDLDPDLPLPDRDALDLFAGLHVLRHVQRFVSSLGLDLVITGDREYSELSNRLTRSYDDVDGDVELRRYRWAQRPQQIRDGLRRRPPSVLLLGMSGSSCVGWTEVTWDGVRVDRYLAPGQLFAFIANMASMSVSGQRPQRLHIAAWQEPFPTHSLATWGPSAELYDGPQELSDFDLEASAEAFRTGHPPTPGRMRNW